MTIIPVTRPIHLMSLEKLVSIKVAFGAPLEDGPGEEVAFMVGVPVFATGVSTSGPLVLEASFLLAAVALCKYALWA